MNFILPAEFLTTPLAAAANLIGVITSDKALADAKNFFPNWQVAAHRCSMIATAQMCAHQQHVRQPGQQASQGR